jgi:hypothetical protein
VELAVVVPSPSWPLKLPPQHFTAPPLVTAQVYPPPADTATALSAEHSLLAPQTPTSDRQANITAVRTGDRVRGIEHKASAA